MARTEPITDKLYSSIGKARAARAGGSALRLSPISRALALALCSVSSIALANPQGGVVQAGQAKIQQTEPSRLDIIQSTQRAAINWQSFSIGRAEHVNFQQPSASAATLNRVVGADPSVILGRLSANGQVFLINPNGMLVGQGAKIDVGGLIASTTNLSNENFMAGRYTFDGVSNRQGTIVNRGEITAAKGGLVALVAPGVENTGVIRAQLGKVALASGNAFTLDLYGDKLIRLVVEDGALDRLTDVEGRSLRSLVANSGHIEADGGSVLLETHSARSVLDSAINMSGSIQARSFEQRAGEIVLYAGEQGRVAVSGVLDASARETPAQGGRVSVLGKEIELAASSRIDVSGQTGGGTALAGGDWQGAGATPRATTTTMQAGARIEADALDAGDGGKVVVWADGNTHFAGEISARGGTRSGDGGNVEVSSKQHLHYAGLVDAGAPKGRAGNLLLDPVDWFIGTADANLFSRQLRLGTNITVQADRDIEVNESIDGRGGAAGASLALNAGNQLRLNNDLLTNNGAINLTAGAGGVLMGNGSRNTGNQGALVYAGNAPISINSVGPVQAQHLITTGAIGITATGANGYVYLNRNLNGLGDTPIGSLSISASGTYSQARTYYTDYDFTKSPNEQTPPTVTKFSNVAVRLREIRSSGPVTITGTQPGSEILLDGIINAAADVTLNASSVRARHSVFADGGNITVGGRLIVEPWGDEVVLAFQECKEQPCPTALSGSIGGSRLELLSSNSYPVSLTGNEAPGAMLGRDVIPLSATHSSNSRAFDAATSQVTLRASQVGGNGGRIVLTDGVERDIDIRTDQQYVKLDRSFFIDGETDFVGSVQRASFYVRSGLPLVPMNDIRLNLEASSGVEFRAASSSRFRFGFSDGVSTPTGPRIGVGLGPLGDGISQPYLRLIVAKPGGTLDTDPQTVSGQAGAKFAGELFSYNDLPPAEGFVPLDTFLPDATFASKFFQILVNGTAPPPGATQIGSPLLLTEFVLRDPRGLALATNEEVFVVNRTQRQDEASAADEGGPGLSQSADLGLGFAANGSAADVFRYRWQVAGLRGVGSANADNDYFGLSLFDYLARLRSRALR